MNAETDLARRPPARVAVAEDDDDLRAAIADTLGEHGFEVSLVPDGPSLMAHLELADRAQRYPDLLVLDHRMPGKRGLDILGDLRAAGSHLRTIFITGCGVRARTRARDLGVFAVFSKPFDLKPFMAAVRRGVERRDTDRLPAPITPGAPACAACGSTEHLRLGERAAGVYFCADCWSRSEPPGPLDDLGGSG